MLSAANFPFPLPPVSLSLVHVSWSSTCAESERPKTKAVNDFCTKTTLPDYTFVAASLRRFLTLRPHILLCYRVGVLKVCWTEMGLAEHLPKAPRHFSKYKLRTRAQTMSEKRCVALCYEIHTLLFTWPFNSLYLLCSKNSIDSWRKSLDKQLSHRCTTLHSFISNRANEFLLDSSAVPSAKVKWRLKWIKMWTVQLI